MAKNFDDHRQKMPTAAEREFIIGGETFRAKAKTRPEVLAIFDQIELEKSPTVIIGLIDSFLLKSMEPVADGDDFEARYRALREREDDPLTFEDLIAVGEWLVEAATGRPTERPDASSSGPGTTGTSSTAASSSPDTPTASTD